MFLKEKIKVFLFFLLSFLVGIQGASNANQPVEAIPLVGNQLSNGAIPGGTPEAYKQAVIDSELPPPPVVPSSADTIYPLIAFDFIVRGNHILEIDAIYINDNDISKIKRNPYGVKIQPIASVNPTRNLIFYPEAEFGNNLRAAAAFLLRDSARITAFGLEWILVDFNIRVVTWEEFFYPESLKQLLDSWTEQSGFPPKNYIIVPSSSN